MSQVMLEKIAYENGRILSIKDIQDVLKIPVTETYLISIGYGPDYIEQGRPENSWWYEFRLSVVAMGISKAILRESYSRREGQTYGTSKETGSS